MITQLIKNGEVVDTSAESNSSSSTSKKSGGSLDKDAFLQLLVAQMKYQDPLNQQIIQSIFHSWQHSHS